MSNWVFLGDSVTDCQRKRASRFQGQSEALGRGWVSHVARKMNAAGVDVEIWNRGFSGALTGELMRQSDWWPAVEDQPMPAQITSLMLGINDIWHPFWKQTPHDLDASLAAYRQLLLTLQNRSERIVMVEPIALPCGEVQPDWWAPLLQLTEGQRRLAEEFNCLWVPLQDALMSDARGRFEEYLYDGVHPTDLGHRWLSIRWLNALTDAGLTQG